MKFEEKYNMQNQKAYNSDDEFQTPENTPRVPLNTAETIHKKATAKTDYFSERELFRQFLQTQPGFEACEPYLWPEISDFANAFLVNSVDPEISRQLLDHIKGLSREVARLKHTQGISKADVDTLKRIGSKYTNPDDKELRDKLYAKLSKAMNKQSNLSEAPDRAWQADVDALLLHDRLDQCKRINPHIGGLLYDALVASGTVAADDWLFAPPKAYPRSKVKLDEQTKKHSKTLDTQVGSQAMIESYLYQLKDLLRASVITDTPAESEKVFDMLTSLPFAKVVEVKNG